MLRCAKLPCLLVRWLQLKTPKELSWCWPSPYGGEHCGLQPCLVRAAFIAARALQSGQDSVINVTCGACLLFYLLHGAPVHHRMENIMMLSRLQQSTNPHQIFCVHSRQTRCQALLRL